MNTSVKMLREITDRYRVKPGKRVKLERDFDPAATSGFADKEEATEFLSKGIELLADMQAKLAAQDRWGVLVCLQALDAAGKDGTIRHVMSGVNPQGTHVATFKVPSEEEVDHSFLWRYQSHLPRRGDIAIFNRSHYEEVLVARVHEEVIERQRLPRPALRRGLWTRRYRDINAWEQHLADNGFKVVKIFLNVSKEEQRQRFLSRLDNAEKHWKFSAADARERRYWDQYQTAYEQMLSATSTEWAPWYVVPADHKWFMRSCVAAILALTLTEIDPRFPVLDEAAKEELTEARWRLEAEACAGSPDEMPPELPAEPAEDPTAEEKVKITGKKAKKSKSSDDKKRKKGDK